MAVRRRKRRANRRGRKHNAPRVRRRTRSNPRPRRRRRNWASPGLVVPPNPHRRRRRRSNPSRKHHHRRRHNPVFAGFGIPPIKTVLFAGLGFAGPSLVSGFLTSTFPSVMQTTTSMGVAGKYIVKIASVFGLSWLTKRFVGRAEGQMVLIGGGANIALSIVNDFMPGILPANPLGMYLPTVMPAAGTQGGMHAVRGMRGNMRAYVPLRGLNAARPMATASAFPASGAVHSGAYGGTAARFKRF